MNACATMHVLSLTTRTQQAAKELTTGASHAPIRALAQIASAQPGAGDSVPRTHKGNVDFKRTLWL